MITIGNSIGPYEVRELLGQGGMAAVYKVWHTQRHCYRALKTSLSHNPNDEYAARLALEARHNARLHHPHIVTIFDIENTPVPYFTMELIEGGDLAALIHRRGRLSLEETGSLLQQVASALDFAHHNGVLHRDVKPSNILLQNTSYGSYLAKVVDFGISRAQEPEDGTRLTKTGMFIGTPEYMSPEQAGSGARVDGRTDQYSLGIIAYEMLCGEPPFKAESDTSLLAVIIQHVRDEPRPPRELEPSLPQEANDVILRALSKDPVLRFGSCSEFVEALLAAMPYQIHKTAPVPEVVAPPAAPPTVQGVFAEPVAPPAAPPTMQEVLPEPVAPPVAAPTVEEASPSPFAPPTVQEVLPEPVALPVREEVLPAPAAPPTIEAVLPEPVASPTVQEVLPVEAPVIREEAFSSPVSTAGGVPPVSSQGNGFLGSGLFRNLMLSVAGIGIVLVLAGVLVNRQPVQPPGPQQPLPPLATPTPLPPPASTPEPVRQTYTFTDKSVYRGELLNGIPHGIGTRSYPDKSKIEAEWAGGKLVRVIRESPATGVLKRPDGSTYHGQILAGKRSGKGKLTLSTGLILSGQFENDRPVGEVLLQYRGKSEKIAPWTEAGQTEVWNRWQTSPQSSRSSESRGKYSGGKRGNGRTVGSGNKHSGNKGGKGKQNGGGTGGRKKHEASVPPMH